MPNQGKSRKSLSAIHREHHVLVTASLRFDGWAEVTEVVVVGVGRWRRPLEVAFGTLDAALEAGMNHALAQFVPGAAPRAAGTSTGEPPSGGNPT